MRIPRPKNHSIGVLISGGLDSAALTGTFLRQGFEVLPIYIKCGLRWEKTEMAWARKFLKSIKTLKLHPLRVVPLLLEHAYDKNWSRRGITPGQKSSDESVFLPARNLLLTSKALLSLHDTKTSTLALATLSGNPFPDAKKSYFKSLEKILSQSFLRPVKILTPFREMKKKEVIQRNRDWPLHLSFSCISPKGIYHCGKCNKCAERRKAFKEAGVPDKTIYRN